MKGLDELKQEMQDGLQPLQPVLVVPSSPPAVGLGEAVQLGTPCQGWAHVMVARTHVMVARTYIISATVHRQDLSRDSFLLAPPKYCYRNQNPQ